MDGVAREHCEGLSMWERYDLCFLLFSPPFPTLEPPSLKTNPGTMGGLFLDGDESPALEDVSKWTVEDVCSFVGGLSGCAEYAQVRSGPLSDMDRFALASICFPQSGMISSGDRGLRVVAYLPDAKKQLKFSIQAISILCQGKLNSATSIDDA